MNERQISVPNSLRYLFSYLDHSLSPKFLFLWLKQVLLIPAGLALFRNKPTLHAIRFGINLEESLEWYRGTALHCMVCLPIKVVCLKRRRRRRRIFSWLGSQHRESFLTNSRGYALHCKLLHQFT